ncbi:MAG: hypothetical protein LIO56_04525 [Lachnospiraceae bacterium]|nr:hypothetical protein [Lachnospiraceae bacterium]
MYEDINRVPVMHGDEQKSYYKWFNRELPEIPQWKQDILKDPVKDPSIALSIHDKNKLFDPGELPTEVGIYFPEEGGAIIHNQQFFPNATGAMGEWWFAWFPGDDMRFQIWDPLEHRHSKLPELGAMERLRDPNVPVAEKSRGLLVRALESGERGSETYNISDLYFMDPAEAGYDAEKIHTDACSFLLCCNVFIYTPAGTLPAFGTHFWRDVEGGCQMRTFFWVGYQVINGEGKCLAPKGVTPPLPALVRTLRHNYDEYEFLAQILPDLYAEEKDNWAN